MLVANRHASREPYPQALRDILSIERAQESRRWLANWDLIRPGPTPLCSMKDLSAQLGVQRIWVKDESVRSPLGSFKALGAPIALARLILRLRPEAELNPRSLFAGAYRTALADLTVISATDGNHGRGLAAAARTVGCRCVIVLHANVSVEREDAIRSCGAQIVRVKGDYDESVGEAARLAQVNGWHVVSDTSYEGYEDIPRDVMQGYGTIAAEIAETLPSDGPITHVLLQGGVGGLAAGIVSYMWELHEAARPTFVVVEPEQADCLYQSALQGRPARATGSVDSVMAGLACGETSPLAWKFLQCAADWFMTVKDEDAVEAMRSLAQGGPADPPIVAGESGAAGLAGLIQLQRRPALAERVGLGPGSTVLLINTEGATAPSVYAQLVGETEAQVLLRQRRFLDQSRSIPTF